MHFLFAWRYFKAKKSTNAINIIAWISIGAIVIGTTALILVLSVFNGFESLVKSLYSSFYTDIKVSPASGKIMQLTEEQLRAIRGTKGIKNYSLIVEEKGLIQTRTRQFGEEESQSENQMVIHLKGVDENYRYVTGVEDHMVGNFELGDSVAASIILGTGIQGSLGVSINNDVDPLIVYLPRKNTGDLFDPINSIAADTVRLTGNFQIQQEFDNKYGITNIDFVKKGLQLGPEDFTGVEIALNDPGGSNEVKRSLQQLLGGQYKVQDRYEQNQSLYAIMNLERWVIYGVLCLILVIAAFNMIGALTMLVLEKQKDINVLHALGGKRSFIRKVFLSEGLLLALIGGATGMLLAFIIAWLQINFHLIPLQGGSFLIDYFPVKLRLMDFLLVGATVFVIAVIASLIPSAKAARQEFSLRAE